MAAAAWAAWTAVALSAESGRKTYVGGKIAEKVQKKEVEKAEAKAKAQEAKNTMVSQEAAKKAKLTQKEAVTKSPFANKKKGNLRSQFTVGGGGSDSGVNY